ncbi:unnamed protein product [Caenorhabditis sp. 36 PRJEB53466]|nr:unnamed protein product [Caenorhabditis sp. 36 PRJEB53466]
MDSRLNVLPSLVIRKALAFLSPLDAFETFLSTPHLVPKLMEHKLELNEIKIECWDDFYHVQIGSNERTPSDPYPAAHLYFLSTADDTRCPALPSWQEDCETIYLREDLRINFICTRSKDRRIHVTCIPDKQRLFEAFRETITFFQKVYRFAASSTSTLTIHSNNVLNVHSIRFEKFRNFNIFLRSNTIAPCWFMSWLLENFELNKLHTLRQDVFENFSPKKPIRCREEFRTVGNWVTFEILQKIDSPTIYLRQPLVKTVQMNAYIKMWTVGEVGQNLKLLHIDVIVSAAIEDLKKGIEVEETTDFEVPGKFCAGSYISNRITDGFNVRRTTDNAVFTVAVGKSSFFMFARNH